MPLSILTLLYFGGFSAAMMGAIVLFSRWRVNLAYLYLAALVFAFGTQSLFSVLYYGDFYERLPWLIYFPIDLCVFGPSFFYLYLSSLFGKRNRQKTILVFLIPGILKLSQLYFWSYPISEKLGHLDDNTWKEIMGVYKILAAVFTTILIIISVRMIETYLKQIDQYYSPEPYPGFQWAKPICYFILIINFITCLPSSQYLENYYPYFILFIFVTSHIMLVWGVVIVMNKTYLTIPSSIEGEEELDESEEPSMTKDEIIFAKLFQEVEENEHYRLVDLSLNDLAKLVSMSPRKLSNLVNQQTGNNFRNFINSFRVNHAKRELERGALESINMNGLAEDSGFKSRTTFYTAFKLEVGLTPLQYLESKDDSLKTDREDLV